MLSPFRTYFTPRVTSRYGFHKVTYERRTEKGTWLTTSLFVISGVRNTTFPARSRSPPNELTCCLCLRACLSCVIHPSNWDYEHQVIIEIVLFSHLLSSGDEPPPDDHPGGVSWGLPAQYVPWNGRRYARSSHPHVGWGFMGRD